MYVYLHVYIKSIVSVCPSLSVSMQSHSFEDTELKLCRSVEDDPGQVVEGIKLWGCYTAGGLGRERVEEAVRRGAGPVGLGLGCCKGPGNAGQPS